MKTFYRILGIILAGGIAIATLLVTLIESIKDISYLWWLFACYGISAIFLFGIYLIFKPYKKSD